MANNLISYEAFWGKEFTGPKLFGPDAYTGIASYKLGEFISNESIPELWESNLIKFFSLYQIYTMDG